MPQSTHHAADSKQSLSALFSAAFRHSRNAMVLLDDERNHVDVNGAYLTLLAYRRDELLGRPVYSLIVGGPRASKAEWHAAISQGHFSGDTELRRADGNVVAVQYAATTEVVTGRYLVLFVILTSSRWGPRFRRTIPSESRSAPLSAREREVVRLVALGYTDREIADALYIAHDTVRTHVRNAMRKLHARSRAHLVAKALAQGLVLGE
jgi:PAS domain S-box-containing protein